MRRPASLKEMQLQQIKAVLSIVMDILSEKLRYAFSREILQRWIVKSLGFIFSLAQAITQCSQSGFLFDLSLQLFPNDPVISWVE